MIKTDLHCGDSAEVLATLAGESIDLTVTSPPYDNLRTYNGFTFDFERIAAELWRVTKPGGVVVWVAADATVKGSETGTSFRQALHFMGLGFNLHDTMIYEKTGTGACGSNLAYWQSFEYMFVLSKGRPKTINRIADHVNVRAGALVTKGRLSASGADKDAKHRTVPEKSVRTNIWRIHSSKNDDPHIKHPAKFPEALARDHIISWSSPGDTVLDPFAGSGTTLKMARELGRHSIGVDISQEYIDLARQRLEVA